VSLDGKWEFVGRDAVAVVTDADFKQTGAADVDADVRSSGIKRILNEFLDDGGGAFNHLTGRDAGGDCWGKDAD